MFHWTPARPIEECIIVRMISFSHQYTIFICQDKKEAAMTVLNGHVVVSQTLFIYSVWSSAN